MLSKQRLSNQVVDTTCQAYRFKVPHVTHVNGHLTRSVHTTWTTLKGVSLSDI